MPGMTPYLAMATALSGLNVLLLVALTLVWVRNYRAFRTPMTLGLAGFGVVLLVENAVALWFYFGMGMLYAGSQAAQLTVLGMRSLQFLALVLLTWVTMR